jgi:two-component system phosphate regulon sensor histidine kinase PhoR
MKITRTRLFIAVSSIALLIVLLIQVNWILKTAKIKEELFNEKANLVLERTTEAIRADRETCKRIGDCVETDTTSRLALKLGKTEVHKIDSLLNHFMKYYNFHLDYSFEVIRPENTNATNESSFANYIFNKPLEDVTAKNELRLKLLIPEKRQFILEEMGTLFITSVILILIVLTLFARTVSLLLKEKKIAEHTNEFLNNMTHEFNTPLTNIALAGKMIIKDGSVNQPEKLKHYTGIILDENEKLKLQVEQVLSMTALERGEIPLQKSELDFHRLILDAIKSIGLQIENKQGNVSVKLNAESFLVYGDKSHLANVMRNLLDNAIKYANGKPEICISTSDQNGNLIVEVSDKGIGIEKQYQEKIFEKFFRVPTGNVHDVKGFGLGLAYIKKITGLHGGTIELRSEKGKGTIFTITLPHA